ncbi:uncharacterized protein [Mytilus edulis]|uniref:Death domain-containing protein n=1 Tax=Mytilus galloprovincialis TaxID=29158 RepID=A0A8B6EY39_MYTGA|nr:Hypothetical predicted protein [Mytilus galloprovincialis]
MRVLICRKRSFKDSSFICISMGVSFRLDNIDAGTATGKSKENAVLKDGSLAVLARVVGVKQLKGLMLAMYLNIPNTSIINLINEQCPETGLSDANDKVMIETTQKCLLYWKQIRSNSKDKDKLKELKTALEKLGEEDIRKVIEDKAADNLELTADAFSE